MRVCLLGTGGFIGSHLVEWLLRNSDAELVGTDIDHGKIRHLLGEPRFSFYSSDIRNDRQLTAYITESADVVVDLVAIANPALYTRDPAQILELDFLENVKVAQLCAETHTRLVQFSTCEVYGKTWLSLVPDGLLTAEQRAAADVTMREDDTPFITGPVHKTRWMYSASKQLLERAIHAYGLTDGLNYTIVRPFNIVGPRFDYLPSEGDDEQAPRMFAQFMDALLTGTQISLVDGGRAQRSFVYIDDAVECIGPIVLDTSGVTSRQAINVGNPANETSIEALALLMRERYVDRYWDGRTPLSSIVDVSHERLFGAGYEDSDRRVPDISKARALLGWEPRWNLSDLVDATMESFVTAYRGPMPSRAAAAG